MSENLIVTPEKVRAFLQQSEVTWRAALPSQRPFLSGLPEDFAALRGASGPQQTLLDELRRVADEITDSHWLRVYSHNAKLTEAARTMMDVRAPTYRPWRDFLIAGQIELDARQELWQRDVGDNMVALALAALIWEDEKYVVSLKNHVLNACVYPHWGAAKGLKNLDLSCAHLSRGIAIARDWLPDIWSPDELDLIRQTIAERVQFLLEGVYGAAYWHSNWLDNHCQDSVAALGICGLAFMDEIPAAPEWLAAAQLGFELVAKLGNADGSSPEGIPYWSYGASFFLQFIELTRGVAASERLYDSAYLRQAFHYRLQSSTPDLGATLPFGDAVKHDYYGPAHLLFALARQYRDPHAQWLAQSLPFQQVGGADCEAWSVLWCDPTLTATAPALALDAHLPIWDVAVTRSGWTNRDYVLAIKSGYTNRNHSHLDAGALVLAWGDEWLLTAPGYGIVGEGFWDFSGGARWTFYSNSTESHSTLLINGGNQRFDRDARGTIETFEIAPDATRTVIDLTEAYHGVKSVRREILHRRGSEIMVMDEIELDEVGTVEWLLQPGGAVELENGVVRATVQHGSLEAQMLWPALPFERRAPTQPHLDVALASVQTCAVKQSGQKLRFVCRIALHRGEKP